MKILYEYDADNIIVSKLYTPRDISSSTGFVTNVEVTANGLPIMGMHFDATNKIVSAADDKEQPIVATSVDISQHITG
jgi:hypothetical protein